jgi:hypothetical protein
MPQQGPPLTESQVLAWADAHLAWGGERPTGNSGRSAAQRGRSGATSTLCAAEGATAARGRHATAAAAAHREGPPPPRLSPQPGAGRRGINSLLR